jgi:asparagine N-glycosylation enzyme membrane subunit Stt3
MRKAIINIGIGGTVIMTVGAIFKFSKWPGGINTIAIGSIFLAIYVFLYMLEQAKTFNSKIEKAYTIIFSIAGMLMIIGLPLELMRWPGTIVIFSLFFVFFLGLLIISLIRALKEKDKELRYKYTNNFIFLLAGGIILLYPSILWILQRLPGYQ